MLPFRETEAYITCLSGHERWELTPWKSPVTLFKRIPGHVKIKEVGRTTRYMRIIRLKSKLNHMKILDRPEDMIM